MKRFREDHMEARNHFQSALSLYETEGDKSTESIRGKAICIQRLADTAHYYLDHDVAKTHYEEALPLFRRARDLVGEASCYKGLADIARNDKRQSSRDNYETAKKLFEEIPYWLGAADCYYSLGDLALSEGQFREATRSYDQAAQRYTTISSKHGLANCKYSKADILLVAIVIEHGDQQQAIDEATRLYNDALIRYRLLKDRVGIANSLQGLSDVALLSGKYEENKNLQQNASRELPEQFRSGRRDCHLDLPNPLTGRWRM